MKPERNKVVTINDKQTNPFCNSMISKSYQCHRELWDTYNKSPIITPTTPVISSSVISSSAPLITPIHVALIVPRATLHGPGELPWPQAGLVKTPSSFHVLLRMVLFSSVWMRGRRGGGGRGGGRWTFTLLLAFPLEWGRTRVKNRLVSDCEMTD